YVLPISPRPPSSTLFPYPTLFRSMYAGHARQAGLLASQVRAGAYLNRMVVVVDEDIDITDLSDVMWAVLTRADPEQDYEIIRRRSEEHTSELQSPCNLVCRLLLEK